MERYWKVGDLAKLTGLTVRTLRFYDKIGLFSPSGKTESVTGCTMNPTWRCCSKFYR